MISNPTDDSKPHILLAQALWRGEGESMRRRHREGSNPGLTLWEEEEVRGGFPCFVKVPIHFGSNQVKLPSTAAKDHTSDLEPLG